MLVIPWLLYTYGMVKVQLQVWGFRCERCGHEWVPRRDEEPRVCPKCKSPYWNRPRKAVASKGEKPKSGQRPPGL